MEISNGGFTPLTNGGTVRINDGNRGPSQSEVVDIYPLRNYYFGSKSAVQFRDESLSDRFLRLKSNYDKHGLRTCVEAVMLVELFKHPHVLLLQVRNCVYKLPGGRIRPGEPAAEIDGLKRKLCSKLSAGEDDCGFEWEVGECLGRWWRPDFESSTYPYLSSNVKNPKECTKLFLVKLPENQDFVVPRNLKLLAVPLCQIHENHETYGSIISGVPQLLSRFSFNVVEY